MAAKPKTSTEVAKAKIQLPSNAADIMAADLAALGAKLAAPTGKAIQVTQSKEFRFPDGEKYDTFKGVIIGFVSQNAYYEGEFDRENIVPPNCFAIGTVKNDDLVASGNAPDPQNPDDGGECATCWANQWKSAAKGNGKACKNSIKLAVLCSDGEVRPMSVSSTALKPFGEYVREVVQAFGAAPYAVMTEFSFDSKVDYSSVRFGNPVRLNDTQLAEALSRKDDAIAMLSTEPDVSEFAEKVIALREKPKAKAAPAKAKSAARA